MTTTLSKENTKDGNTEYIVILHYNTGEVFYKELSDDDNYLLDVKDDIEQFFNKYKLNIDECSWMFTSTEPNLTYLEFD